MDRWYHGGMLKIGSNTIPLIPAVIADVEYEIYEPTGVFGVRLTQVQDAAETQVQELRQVVKAADAILKKENATDKAKADAKAKREKAISDVAKLTRDSIRKQIELIWQPRDHDAVEARYWDAADGLAYEFPHIIKAMLEYQSENPTGSPSV